MPELAVLEVGCCPRMRDLPMPFVEPRERPTAAAVVLN